MLFTPQALQQILHSETDSCPHEGHALNAVCLVNLSCQGHALNVVCLASLYNIADTVAYAVAHCLAKCLELYCN